MTKALDAALELFSTQGFGATSMRQIADRSGVSVGNLYHHFSGKEELFQRLIDRYWERLLDPELPLNQLFARGRFPDDLEEMAEAVESVVEDNTESILLIYVDVIEFRGQHIASFYESMADRFRESYEERFAEGERQGLDDSGAPDPMVAVMVAVRWFFYFFTVEKCFGVPMHMGLSRSQAVEQFIRLIRHGLLPRGGEGDRDTAGGADAPGRTP